MQIDFHNTQYRAQLQRESRASFQVGYRSYYMLVSKTPFIRKSNPFKKTDSPSPESIEHAAAAVQATTINISCMEEGAFSRQEGK